MSKVKVDQIESSDSNVKIAGKGTGVVKVKASGGTDAAIQLSSGSGAHGVKIKSPPHSAGQSHTLILPDNNIEQDKFLKIKSISGSGSTAVGQLEYASLASPDLTQMDGSHFTSGSIPSGRFTNAFNGSSGAGYKLVSTTNVTTPVARFNFTFDDNSVYYLIGKNITLSSIQYQFRIYFLYSDGLRTFSQNLQYNTLFGATGSDTKGQNAYNRASIANLNISSGTYPDGYHDKFSMYMEISTRKQSNFIKYRCIGTNFATGSMRTEADISYNELYQFLPLHGIQLDCSGQNFTTGTKFLLYKYGET